MPSGQEKEVKPGEWASLLMSLPGDTSQTSMQCSFFLKSLKHKVQVGLRLQNKKKILFFFIFYIFGLNDSIL